MFGHERGGWSECLCRWFPLIFVLGTLSSCAGQQAAPGVTGSLDELKKEVRALRDETSALKSEVAALRELLTKEAEPKAPAAGTRTEPPAEQASGPASDDEIALPAQTDFRLIEEAVTLYNDAFSHYASGESTQALLEFQELLVRFPTAEVADNAHYWIGQIYFERASFERALEAYQEVVQDYPSSDKLPEALLKAGLCLEKLGRSEDAKQVFKRLVLSHPDSEAATVAKEHLTDKGGEVP